MMLSKNKQTKHIRRHSHSHSVRLWFSNDHLLALPLLCSWCGFCGALHNPFAGAGTFCLQWTLEAWGGSGPAEPHTGCQIFGVVCRARKGVFSLKAKGRYQGVTFWVALGNRSHQRCRTEREQRGAPKRHIGLVPLDKSTYTISQTVNVGSSAGSTQPAALQQSSDSPTPAAEQSIFSCCRPQHQSMFLSHFSNTCRLSNRCCTWCFCDWCLTERCSILHCTHLTASAAVDDKTFPCYCWLWESS